MIDDLKFYAFSTVFQSYQDWADDNDRLYAITVKKISPRAGLDLGATRSGLNPLLSKDPIIQNVFTFFCILNIHAPVRTRIHLNALSDLLCTFAVVEIMLLHPHLQQYLSTSTSSSNCYRLHVKF